MISWIQRTFQHHFKWLFLLLLAVVVISFVFVTNASSGLGQGGQRSAARPYFGLNLNSREDIQRFQQDASLSAYLNGLQIRDQGQFEQYALQRVAALHVATDYRLPEPTAEDLARHIQTLKAFAGADGKFDAKRYNEFVDSLRTNPQVKESDVKRVIADDVVYQQVLKLLSGPGYVQTADIERFLERSDSTWTIEAAVVDYSSFKPAVTASDEELTKYFEFNAARYEIAPKVVVSYIDFPASAYTGQVTASEEGLRAYYDANAARFTPPAKDEKAPKPTADVAFAAARKQVEEAYKLERARKLAADAAADLSVALHENKVTPASLDVFLAERKLAAKKLPAFNAENVPAELGTGYQVATEALKTNATRPFSDAIDTGRGSAILVWNESIAARQPALADVKERVKADYVEAEKRKRFAEAGRTLRAAIETRLKAGDTFAKAVTASAAVIPAKVTAKSWPAFTLSAPPQDIDYTIYGAIENLHKGELSQMASSAENGFIVYAADKKAPAFDPTSAKYIQIRDRLTAVTASRNGSEHLSRIVQAELAKSGPLPGTE